ncbi:MAG: pseudouridine synthase, partial [Sphingobacteriales bacterium]
MHRYFIINKPSNMLSQFKSADMVGLHDLKYPFPEGIHAIGRLDKDSEGLLLLTTNTKVTRLLFQGAKPHQRTYLVKVRYTVSQESLTALRNGVSIRIKGGGYYISTPCEVDIVTMPEGLFSNPFESKDYHSYTWLRITLTEGKFHQIRKMVNAVHHRCKRLIRVSIEQLELADLQPGDVQIDTFYNRETLIDFSTHTVTHNLIEGIVFVTVIVFLFMADWRTTLTVSIVIPLALLFAFICLRLKGMSANLLSMGAIDFGIIVDGAVVMVEGIFVTMDELAHRVGMARFNRLAKMGLLRRTGTEMGKAIFFSKLIIITCLIPIFSFQKV